MSGEKSSDMYLKIIFLSAAIFGISQGGVTKGRYEILERKAIEARNPYLMGGSIVKDRIYPWMVSIRYNDIHVCGGVILNENWILTAAQCLENRSPSSITAMVGSNDLYSGDKYTVAKAILHQDYDPAESWRNDIGLLQVHEPIRFTWGTVPAQLPSKELIINVDDGGVVIGWGSQEAGGELSSALRSLNTTVTSKSYCNKAYNPFHLNVYEKQFCDSGADGRGACEGDMGGPFIFHDEVIGIVSWGKPCGYSGFPSVYTRVNEYIDWINDYIRQV